MTEKPWWRPEVLGPRLPLLRRRAAVVQTARLFFIEQGFEEVETPVLQVAPGMEPHLHAFATELAEPFAQGQRRMYLHTSPEFAMKKLLAGGVPRIFQMARVFRNGERSPLHHPEFTMLEWYRAGASYRQVMDDCEALVQACARAVETRQARWQGRGCDLFSWWWRISVAEAFDQYAGIDLLAAIQGDPRDPDPAPLAAEARRLGLHVGEDDRFDDVFFRIMLEKVEPHLGVGAPTILYDYPLCMAALARPKPEDERLAERFEVYVCGVELANGFGELTDAAEQRRRFEADMALKQSLYGECWPLDEDFIAAVGAMPEAAGIALGLDRLVMLLLGAGRIEDVLWAPVAEAPSG